MRPPPPCHSAHPLRALQGWRAELLAAMERVKSMRVLLRTALEARFTPGTWNHITEQIGMFSYTGACLKGGATKEKAQPLQHCGLYPLSDPRLGRCARRRPATTDTHTSPPPPSHIHTPTLQRRRAAG